MIWLASQRLYITSRSDHRNLKQSHDSAIVRYCVTEAVIQYFMYDNGMQMLLLSNFITVTLSNIHINYSFQCFEDFLREVTGDDIIDEFKTKFVEPYLDIFKEFEVFLSSL